MRVHALCRVFFCCEGDVVQCKYPILQMASAAAPLRKYYHTDNRPIIVLHETIYMCLTLYWWQYGSYHAMCVCSGNVYVNVRYHTVCICSGNRHLHKLNRGDDLSVWRDPNRARGLLLWRRVCNSCVCQQNWRHCGYPFYFGAWDWCREAEMCRR